VRTPAAAAMPPVLVLAHTVSSLLEEHFYVRPPWARAFELGLLALITLYLALALPRLRATTADFMIYVRFDTSTDPWRADLMYAPGTLASGFQAPIDLN
jgi:hypothetical protein